MQDRDPKLLAERDARLADDMRSRVRDPAFMASYRHAALEEARRFTRLALPLLVLVFDSFFIAELGAAPPGLLALSACLRFGVLTPAVVLFVWLDAHDRLGRAYRAITTAMLVAPTLFACIEVALTVNPDLLPSMQAIPLIMLAAIVIRYGVVELLVAIPLSCGLYITAICLSPVVPRHFIASMILTDLAIAVAVGFFSFWVEQRDRRVFYLMHQAEAARAALAEQNRGLREDSHTDAVTGCANRRCFDEALAAGWEEALRSGRPIGLILLDIDHFKAYNDHYGHAAGDACLRLVAGRASREVANRDLFARYGGEEFGVVMAGAPPWRVDHVASAIRAAIAAMAIPHEGIGPDAVVTISVGAAAILPDGGSDPLTLLMVADQHLYEAKRGGRNRVAGCAGAPAPEAALA